MSFTRTPWDFGGSPSTQLQWKKLKKLEVSSPNLSLPCKCEASAQNKRRLSLWGCLVSPSKLRQFTMLFSKKGLVKTVSFKPTDLWMSNGSKTVTFVILYTFLLVTGLSLVQRRTILLVCKLFFKLVISSLVCTCLNLSETVLFSCA